MLMMRSIKQIFKGAVVLSVLSLLYNEFLVYYITLYSCKYPSMEGDTSKILDTMILADTHLLGSKNGHWFDKLRREWQMHRAFQTAITYFSPEAVFFLGDVFDEGKWCSPQEFQQYVNRFGSLFYTRNETKTFVIAGNHDVGFHYAVHPYLLKRFQQAYNAKSVRKVTLKGVEFVLINSMAFEGDNCFLCEDAEKRLAKISSGLSCAGPDCPGPVLMSHFPLYRDSDEMCDELDEAPSPDKFDKFREGWECISNSSSQLLKDKLKPRIAFTGHTHHGCRTNHEEGFMEWTVSSFSWRNKNNPAFLLARFSESSVEVSKCFMPEEDTVYLVYMLAGALLVLFFVKLKK